MGDLNLREKLYHKIIDFIFDEYDAETFEEIQTKKNIKDFRQKLTRWKLDFDYRKIIGPLQPPCIMSRMWKVPVRNVEEIASNLSVELPDRVDIREFSLEKLTTEEAELYLSSDIDENSFLDLITSMETPKDKLDVGEPFVPQSFEYIDLTNEDTAALTAMKDQETPMKLHVIQYLENIIQRVKKGEVYSLSVISLFTDGKASMWMPSTINNDTVRKLYDELLEKLRESGSIINDN